MRVEKIASYEIQQKHLKTVPYYQDLDHNLLSPVQYIKDDAGGGKENRRVYHHHSLAPFGVSPYTEERRERGSYTTDISPGTIYVISFSLN